jgi:hypothetical protein
MRNVPIVPLVLTFALTSACSEAGSQPPTAVETQALVASTPSWDPADLTRDLQVDDATRRDIEAGVQALHASMLAVNARFEKGETLAGEARAAYMADLQTELQALHEQHTALWESLAPEVREALAARLHEHMREPGNDGALQSFHERMRRMHGGHDAGSGAH